MGNEASYLFFTLRQSGKYHPIPVIYYCIFAMLFFQLKNGHKIGMTFSAQPAVCICIRFYSIMTAPCFPYHLLILATRANITVEGNQ